ncbi:CD276 antigen-like [Paramisgurnus dabryanus]|uniref:CD276 antigen-like n=1 Tax=Paramisgurnus dabryanus TaxID=90735 RepID=UPI003CCFD831
MVVRCCLIYISTTLLLIDMVSLKVTVKNFVGESAILPCSYTEDKNQVDKVFWRHNDSKKVYEFSPGGLQEIKYDIRVESFPEEFVNGNYSIKIKNLEKNDEGEYNCFITPADHYENIHLIIKDKGL